MFAAKTMMDSFEKEERFHRSTNDSPLEEEEEELVVGSMEEMQATFAKMLLQSEDEEEEEEVEITSHKRSKVSEKRRISFRRKKKGVVMFTPTITSSPFGNSKARRVHRSTLEETSDDDSDSEEEFSEDEENVAPSLPSASNSRSNKFRTPGKKSDVRFPTTPNRSFLVCTPSPSHRRPLSARTTPGSMLAQDRRRTPKNDPVNRYHQLSKVWNQSPFLVKKKASVLRGRRMNFNNNAAGFTPRRDKLRNEYRDQLKTARAEEERKNKARIQRDHRRIMPSNYVVPSMKRRDQLRWNVRAAMLVQED